MAANADGPRDAASRPIDHIVLHTVTEPDAECIHQATVVVSKCVHGEAQTPLARFIVDMFYKQVRNKFATNRTSGV